MKRYSATFRSSGQKDQERDSDSELELRSWLANKLGDDNAPEYMGLYDNVDNIALFVECYSQLDVNTDRETGPRNAVNRL